jgi:hypothetical protein
VKRQLGQALIQRRNNVLSQGRVERLLKIKTFQNEWVLPLQLSLSNLK